MYYQTVIILYRYVWDVEPSQLLLIVAGFQMNELGNVISLPLGINMSPIISLLSDQQSQSTLSSPQLTTLKLTGGGGGGGGGGGSGGGNVFTTPTVPGATPLPAVNKTVPRGGLLVSLLEMGYSSELASQALIQTDNISVEKAVEWINANPQV